MSKRMPDAHYPDVDDALEDARRPTPGTGSPPPPAIPGKDAIVRPLIDGREQDGVVEAPATADFPKAPGARDPVL